MTFTVTTDDPKEAKCLAKATDMAIVIFEFTHNAMRHVPDEFTAEDLMEKFHELLNRNGIIIDDLRE